MQEQQVTIGGTTYPVPLPFIVMATQNPIESEGTYPLPEAQLDRFLMKILVDYPSVGEEAAVVGRSLGAQAEVRERLALEDLRRYARGAETVLVDRDEIAYAVALADATRHPAQHGLDDLEHLIEFGASPRGPISLVQAARVLALLRGPRPRRRRPTSATSRPTCCATGSCSPTTRSARASPRTRCSTACWRPSAEPDAGHLIHESPTAVRAV